VIKTYNTDQGLPNNHVRSIIQDQNGFIWIATWDALSRYDGYEFNNYYHDPDDSLSLPGMNLQKMVIDKKNNLWILSGFGFHKFDRANDKFIPFGIIKDQFFWDINCDKNGQLWVIGNTGLFCFNEENLKFTRSKIYKNGKELDKLSWGLFCFDHDNNLWTLKDTVMVFYKKLFSGDSLNISFELIDYYNFQDLNQFIHNFVLSFNVVSFDSSILLTSNLGMWILDQTHKKFLPMTNIRVLEDIHEATFSCNSFQKDFYYFDKGKTKFFFNPPGESLTEAWLIDANNIAWLGITKETSEGTGLTKVFQPKNHFRHWFIKDESNEQFACMAIHKTKKGTIWLGNSGKDYLFRIEKDKTPIKSVFIDKQRITPLVQSRSFVEHNGKIWVGNYTNYLYCFDTIDYSIENLYPGSLDEVFGDSIKYFKMLLKDKRNQLIFTGAECLYCYNFVTQSLITQIKFPSNDFYCILNDCDTNYWFGANNGKLVFINKLFEEYKEYIIAEGRYNIESVIEGDSNHLWLALLGGGLCRFSKNTGVLEFFSTQHGLRNNTCYNVLKDKHGHIWLSTNQGISMFNPETKRFRNFGESEGLRILEFNADAVWHGDDDEMLFGGMGGFVSFYPDSVENITNDYYAPLLISVSKKTTPKSLIDQKLS
jgi:ligand-binding sensor domain-containing protein